MPTLMTTFEAGTPDEDQLNNLTLWLDQTMFEGFEKVDYRFEYSDDSIHCKVRDLPEDRLKALCTAVDEALRRIVADLAPRTRVSG